MQTSKLLIKYSKLHRQVDITSTRFWECTGINKSQYCKYVKLILNFSYQLDFFFQGTVFPPPADIVPLRTSSGSRFKKQEKRVTIHYHSIPIYHCIWHISSLFGRLKEAGDYI